MHRRAESGDKAIKIVIIERLEEKSELEATVNRLGEMSAPTHELLRTMFTPIGELKLPEHGRF